MRLALRPPSLPLPPHVQYVRSGIRLPLAQPLASLRFAPHSHPQPRPAPCTPLRRTPHWTVHSSAPCTPLRRTSHWTVHSSAPCTPLRRTPHWTVHSSALCTPLRRAPHWTVHSGAACTTPHCSHQAKVGLRIGHQQQAKIGLKTGQQQQSKAGLSISQQQQTCIHALQLQASFGKRIWSSVKSGRYLEKPNIFSQGQLRTNHPLHCAWAGWSTVHVSRAAMQTPQAGVGPTVAAAATGSSNHSPGEQGSDPQGEDQDPLVQHVVIRRDLIDGASGDKGGPNLPKWPLGSVITQGCHAAVAAIWEHREDPLVVQYCSPGAIDSMRKVTLEVKDESQLRSISKKLNEAGVPHKLWIEQPEDFATCLATRPSPKSIVSPLLKKLRLCK